MQLPDLTDQEVADLAPVVSNWNRLNEVLMVADPDAHYLRKLIVVEARTRHRKLIIDRIVARLKSTMHEEVYAALTCDAKVTKPMQQ